jgi:hypothetical protein
MYLQVCMNEINMCTNIYDSKQSTKLAFAYVYEGMASVLGTN